MAGNLESPGIECVILILILYCIQMMSLDVGRRMKKVRVEFVGEQFLPSTVQSCLVTLLLVAMFW
jgi:hypothetical protein